METEDGKKRVKIRQPTHLYIFIDKAIHVDPSLHGSRITLSVSLHPKIYPFTTQPVLVQYKHVKFSLGFSVVLCHLRELSISDLNIQFIIKESISAKILGKCSVQINDEKNSLSSFESLPHYIFKMARFPINSNNSYNFDICQLVATIALGTENLRNVVVPTQILNQETIRFKKNNIITNNKNKIYSPTQEKSLSTKQIQYITKNWKKFAEQNGWTPPQVDTNNEITQKGENKDEIKNELKDGLKNDKTIEIEKPKFSSLMERKLLFTQKRPTNTPSKKKSKIPKFIQKTKSDASYLSDASSTVTKSSSFGLELMLCSCSSSTTKQKSKTKNKRRPFAASVGPKRTTQYQLITDLQLEDNFPDKTQRDFQSDPPPQKFSSDMNEVDESESSGLFSLFDSPSEHGSAQSLGLTDASLHCEEDTLLGNSDCLENIDEINGKEVEEKKCDDSKKKKEINRKEEDEDKKSDECKEIDEDKEENKDIFNGNKHKDKNSKNRNKGKSCTNNSNKERKKGNKDKNRGNDDGNLSYDLNTDKVDDEKSEDSKENNETNNQKKSRKEKSKHRKGKSKDNKKKNEENEVKSEDNGKMKEDNEKKSEDNEKKSEENNEKSDDQKSSSNDDKDSDTNKPNCTEEGTSDTSFSSSAQQAFDRLEAMINVPKKLPYTIGNIADVFDCPPTITFGPKRVFSVHLFRLRPDPRQVKVFASSFHLRNPIKKSPSLEKMFDEGMMALDLDLSGESDD